MKLSGGLILGFVLLVCLQPQSAGAAEAVSLVPLRDASAVAAARYQAEVEGLQHFELQAGRSFDVLRHGQAVGTLVSGRAGRAGPGGVVQPVCILGWVRPGNTMIDRVVCTRLAADDAAGCQHIEAIGIVQTSPALLLGVFARFDGSAEDRPLLLELKDDAVLMNREDLTKKVQGEHLSSVGALRQFFIAVAARDVADVASAQQKERVETVARLASLQKAADGQLRRAERELSPAGRSTLDEAYAARRAYIAKICGVDSGSSCQIEEWKRFGQQLRQAGVHIGPFVFGLRQFLSLSSVGGGAGKAPEAVRIVSVVPVIDKAVGVDPQIVAAWNAARLKAGDAGTDCGGGAEVVNEYSIESATAQFISVLFQDREFCQGATGLAGFRGVNIALAAPPRPIALADLFQPGSDWAAEVSRLRGAALVSSGASKNLYSRQKMQEDLKNSDVIFSIREHALHLVYDTTVNGQGALEVDIPWSALGVCGAGGKSGAPGSGEWPRSGSGPICGAVARLR